MNYIACRLALAALPHEHEGDDAHLKALVDLACANGDSEFAAHLIDRLYAYYDLQECAGTA